VIGGQIDQRKTCGMKIRKSRSSALTDLVYLQALCLRFNYALPFFVRRMRFAKRYYQHGRLLRCFLYPSASFY